MIQTGRGLYNDCIFGSSPGVESGEYLFDGNLLGVVAGHLHVAVLVLGDDAVSDLDARRRRDVVLRVCVADTACAHPNRRCFNQGVLHLILIKLSDLSCVILHLNLIQIEQK